MSSPVVAVQDRYWEAQDHGRRELDVVRQPSLYDQAVLSNDGHRDACPDPSTAITASCETIDNDRAPMLTLSGVVR